MAKRKKIIAANWKLNHTAAQTEQILKDFLELVDENIIEEIDIVFCPPFTSLAKAYGILKDTKINVGAQNMYFEEKGAFTGEVSAEMVKEFCSYVIIGHSERRNIFNENNEDIGKKLFVAINSGLNPILCVGEGLEHREACRQQEVVGNQLVQCLKNISARHFHQLIIAYEPVWAIGTGNNATSEQAEEMHKYIRDKIGELYNSEVAEELRILYGGSVNYDNIKELMDMRNIDGALVGGASLSAESFARIVSFK